MRITHQIAKSLREIYFGENWTSVDLKSTLDGVDWKLATTKVNSLNTIAALVFHINYYVGAVSKFLQDGLLESSDKYSFDVPSISSQADWERLLDKTWSDAETLAGQIEQIPEERLGEIFNNGQYGNYYRNLQGVVEHCYYHLGQIVFIKKIKTGT